MKKYKISEIGIAIPGTVNDDKVIKSVNLGLENYEIVKKLKSKIQVPIKIRKYTNDRRKFCNNYTQIKQKNSKYIGQVNPF